LEDVLSDDDRLLFMMSRAHHRLREYVKTRFAEEGIGASHAQTGILLLLKLSGEPLSMSEISRQFDVDKSAITILVDKLESAGLVTREPHPTDRRVNLITITAAGKREADLSERVAKEINEEIKSGFTQKEVQTFKRVLESFNDKFQLKKETGG
jgi:DNA-binding MarR family transcriptional regulator